MNGENYVTKHNKLIELKGRMTALEQKLLATVISKLNIDDKDFKEYKIYISEIKEYMDSNHKDIYSQLKETANSLRDRKIQIENINPDKKSFLVTGWISSAQYIDGEGYVTIYIDPLLKPYLLELKKCFTKYQLKNVLSLKGTHSIRMYELLKQYQNIGKREFEITELKELLGLKGEYKRFYDFERYVLKSAKKEINNLTDLKIDYEKIKKGRKIEKIKFVIQNNGNENKSLDGLMDFEDIKTKSGLEHEKFNNKQIADLYDIAVKKTENADINPYEYIRVNYLKIVEKGTARNNFAYLKKALEEDYAKSVVQISTGYYIS